MRRRPTRPEPTAAAGAAAGRARPAAGAGCGGSGAGAGAGCAGVGGVLGRVGRRGVAAGLGVDGAASASWASGGCEPPAAGAASLARAAASCYEAPARGVLLRLRPAARLRRRGLSGAGSRGAASASSGSGAGSAAAAPDAGAVADAHERGADLDGLVLLDEDLLDDAGDRRRDLGVDLVGRDLEQGLVDLDRSPTCFSQRVTVPSVTLSPSAGRVTDSLIGCSFIQAASSAGGRRAPSRGQRAWSGLPARARNASPRASYCVGCRG